ncbi:MAG: DMT family transporter [Candidatus Eisenbacteria bacterium]|nr:DMT family transporter [Candidatus Eisenbacteria bacterium]
MTARGAVVSTLAAGLLWGSSFSVIKIGLRSLDPFWFVFLRFAFASVLALGAVMIAGHGRRVLIYLRNPLVIWLGVSNASGFVFQFKGQTMTSASHAALLINASTIFVAIASRFVFRERFGALKTLSVVAGMCGVLLVTTWGGALQPGGPGVVGDMLVLVAAFLWTFFILLDKKIVGGADTDVRALTAAMVVVTALSALPIALVFGRGCLPGLTPDWWTIAYTGAFCTVLPFFLWTSGLRFITATTSSVIMLVEVVFALALAAWLLGERLSPGAIAGSLLILLAVALASGERAEVTPVGPDVVPDQP